MLKNLFVLFFLAVCSLLSQDATPKQPIYIYLFARIDDHVNTDITADRLQRTVKLVEEMRKKHPAAGISAVLQFSGATAAMLADQNAKNGLLTLIRKYQKAGLIETGYDGTNEPAYPFKDWPEIPDFHKLSGAEIWMKRQDLIAPFLVEYRDPLTGKADANRVGGLRETQQVLGPLKALNGLSMELGGDSEVVHLFERTHEFEDAVIFGLLNPSWDRHIVGYGPATEHFAIAITPREDMSPEVYWMDDVLRTSEFAGGSIRMRPATDPDAMKKVVAELNRSITHVLHVELSPESLYLADAYQKGPNFPPVKYAYAHTDNPKLPAEALRPKADVDAAYARQEAYLESLASELFPANPGSRFVSSANLLQMTPKPTNFDVKFEDLQEIAQGIMKHWRNNRPPNFGVAGDRYFSIADTFEMLVTALAEKNRTGKFPALLHLHRVYGPIDFPGEFGDNRDSVSDAGVQRACTELAPKLNSTEWTPVPTNAIPAFILVDERRLNAGQLLHIMAQALVAPEPRYDIHVAFMENGLAMHPRTRGRRDFGTIWTLKPAPLHPPA